MKLTKTSKALFTVVIFFLICSAFFLSGFGIYVEHAFAANSLAQYDYTDSDYLTQGSVYTDRTAFA